MTEKAESITEVRLERPEGERSWAARIEGTHSDYGLERTFLEPEQAEGELVFRLDEPGFYEICDIAADRRFCRRVRRDDEGGLVAEIVSIEDVRTAAAQRCERAALQRREAVEAVRAGEGRAVLMFDVLEFEDRIFEGDPLDDKVRSAVPPAPSGWRLVSESDPTLTGGRIKHVIYLPEELLEDPDPARRARRAFELAVEGGMPPEDAHDELLYAISFPPRGGNKIVGREGTAEFKSSLRDAAREAGLDLAD